MLASLPLAPQIQLQQKLETSHRGMCIGSCRIRRMECWDEAEQERAKSNYLLSRGEVDMLLQATKSGAIWLWCGWPHMQGQARDPTPCRIVILEDHYGEHNEMDLRKIISANTATLSPMPFSYLDVHPCEMVYIWWAIPFWSNIIMTYQAWHIRQPIERLMLLAKG